MSSRILLVEDEPGVALVVGDLLEAEGHIVEVAQDGTSGLKRAIEEVFDLLILDVMLPSLGGFEICHSVRQHGFDSAILMLTAKGQIDDRVQGLGRGADDYIVKPFNPKELAARVKALLRRIHKEGLTPVIKFKFGNVTVDFVRGVFSKNGSLISLTDIEAQLLRTLIDRRGQPMNRNEILKAVWRDNQFITERTVDVHIAWLRQKVEDNPQFPKHLITVRGKGYRFLR